jgi:adenylyltransferase/sulfurtransferase
VTADSHNPVGGGSRPGEDRYSRQILYAPLGVEGQRCLLAAHVVLVGCGGLGSVLAELLVRAGVGRLRIIDRDFVELNNLPRQVLFDEHDAAESLPKAEAARRKLAAINSDVAVEAVVADLNHRNAETLLEGAELLLDGTDNFETRYLLNDVAVKSHRPWIYGACVGTEGRSLVVVPGEGPCLRCLFEEVPETTETCDTTGVLGPAVSLTASRQALEAIKLLSGHPEALDRHFWSCHGWTGRVSRIDVSRVGAGGDCPCCRQGRFDYLEGRGAVQAAALCGRDAVQVSPPPGLAMNLDALADRLRSVAEVPPRSNGFLLRARVEGHELTVFADGRAIVKGVSRPEDGRTLYSRYVGS